MHYLDAHSVEVAHCTNVVRPSKPLCNVTKMAKNIDTNCTGEASSYPKRLWLFAERDSCFGRWSGAHNGAKFHIFLQTLLCLYQV